jgi:hypothetical protein
MKTFGPSSFIFALIGLVFSVQSALAGFDDPACDSICSVLVNPTTKKTLNLAGTGAWGTSDDAWCAANFSSGATPAPSADPNYQNEITRCQFHDGQMISYCDAYESVQQANALELPLLVLDIAGTATCTTACFASTTGALIAPAYMACRTSSIAASGLELLDTFLINGSATSKAINAALGAGGLASNAYELADVGNLKKFMGGDDGTDDKKAQHNACMTASVLAVATGLRVFDVTNQGKAQQSACKQVKSLLSTDPVIGVATPVASPGTSLASGGSNYGGVASNVTSYKPPSVLGNGQINLSDQIACAQSGSTTCAFMNQGVSGATNGGFLASNGLGQALANTITPSALSSMQQAISSGSDAGSLISSALSGSGLSDSVSTKISDIAKNSQADASLIPPASATAYAQSGGAPKAKTSAASGFGGFNFDTAATGAAKEQSFSRGPAAAGPEEDIWHAGYKGSIFKIVSDKIGATKDRVDTMDWSTPLNRALMGLPAHPNGGAAK